LLVVLLAEERDVGPRRAEQLRDDGQHPGEVAGPDRALQFVAQCAGDDAHLREELGDLLLQILFHAVIAEEQGRFDINDVAADLVVKLRRRNPHVFDPQHSEATDPASINEQWERIKADEKQRTGLMDGVPEELPALLRAVKALDRLERAGSTPPVDPESPDLGERLLALVAEARASGVDPEQALRVAVRRVLPS